MRHTLVLGASRGHTGRLGGAASGSPPAWRSSLWAWPSTCTRTTRSSSCGSPARAATRFPTVRCLPCLAAATGVLQPHVCMQAGCLSMSRGPTFSARFSSGVALRWRRGRLCPRPLPSSRPPTLGLAPFSTTSKAGGPCAVAAQAQPDVGQVVSGEVSRQLPGQPQSPHSRRALSPSPAKAIRGRGLAALLDCVKSSR